VILALRAMGWVGIVGSASIVRKQFHGGTFQPGVSELGGLVLHRLPRHLMRPDLIIEDAIAAWTKVVRDYDRAGMQVVPLRRTAGRSCATGAYDLWCLTVLRRRRTVLPEVRRSSDVPIILAGLPKVEGLTHFWAGLGSGRLSSQPYSRSECCVCRRF